MEIELVTLRCAGDCADVEAVAHGGNPPYAFAWEDGSTDAKRHVCPEATTEFSVDATDTAIIDDEFPYDAQTATARVIANVLDCSDAGTAVDGEVYWTDWTTVTVGTPGNAKGAIPLPGGDIQVDYSGEVGTASQSNTGAMNYLLPPDIFLSATVVNLPVNNGIIAVSGDGTTAMQTVTFSEPVRDPMIALYSLGFGSLGIESTWEFEAEPTILSSGTNASGFPGTLTLSGKRLTGNEGNGVVQFTGTFTSIGFAIPVVEPFPGWGAFTVGIRARE